MPHVESIIIRPVKKGEPVRKQEVNITPLGIEGDHSAKPDGKRPVTLISASALAAAAASIGFEGDVHVACRRNILIDHLPEENMEGKIISIGKEVVLEITEYAKPCKRMDENFGEGGVEALFEKAGWGAKVISPGSIAVGDVVLLQ